MDVRISEDREGEDFPDNDAAWHEATLVAGEIFKDVDGAFRPGDECSLEVADEQKRPIFRIHITSKQLA
jgi:hypothetical protein